MSRAAEYAGNIWLSAGPADGRLVGMTTGRDRVICVSLSEAEWRAFIARHPQPVHWIREQILGQLQETFDLPPEQVSARSGG